MSPAHSNFPSLIYLMLSASTLSWYILLLFHPLHFSSTLHGPNIRRRNIIYSPFQILELRSSYLFSLIRLFLTFGFKTWILFFFFLMIWKKIAYSNFSPLKFNLRNICILIITLFNIRSIINIKYIKKKLSTTLNFYIPSSLSLNKILFHI